MLATRPEAEQARQSDARRSAGLPFHIVTVAVLLASSLLLYRNALSDFTASVAGKSGGDTNIFIWWLEYVPWALAHAHNPLVTDYMNYPGSVNGMWNSSVPLLGLVGAPITWLFGPIATYNVMMIAGPVVSGWVFFWVAARYARPLPALVGAAMYGFSPFMMAHLAASHLNLVWNVLPPLLVFLIDEIFVRQRIPAVRMGVIFGVLISIQVGLYVQTVVTGLFVVAPVVIVMAIRWRAQIPARKRYVLRTLAIGTGVTVVLSGFALLVMFLGPGRISGVYRDPYLYVADLANVVIATPFTAWRLGQGDYAGELRLDPGELGFYIGVIVLVAMVLAVFLSRRFVTRAIALGGLSAAVCALGPHLVVLGHSTGLILPWRLFAMDPSLANIETVRFTLFTGFAAAALVALLLDEAPGCPRPAAAGICALGLIGALTWFPAPNTLPRAPMNVPSFFVDGAVDRYVRDGEVARVVPRASLSTPGEGLSMTWQAMTDMRFKMIGGYFVGSQDGTPINESVPDAFDAATDSVAHGNPPPAVGSAEFQDARAALAASGADVMLLVDLWDDPTFPAMLSFVTELTGTAPTEVQGVWVLRLDGTPPG